MTDPAHSDPGDPNPGDPNPGDPTPADLDAFIDAGARLLGLPVRPEWREAIRLHLGISLGHARIVGGFALPDEADPAPVFAP